MGSGKKRDEKIIKVAETREAASRDEANRVEKKRELGRDEQESRDAISRAGRHVMRDEIGTKECKDEMSKGEGRRVGKLEKKEKKKFRSNEKGLTRW